MTYSGTRTMCVGAKSDRSLAIRTAQQNSYKLRKAIHQPGDRNSAGLASLFLLSFLTICVALTGCGSGGYPGVGISSLTATTITLDAGQAISVGSNGSGNLPLAWVLNGASCSGSGCGTLSSTTGTNITYMAPPSVTAPFQVTLTASVAGTQSTRSVTIDVNPAPAIPGIPPSGTVGVFYTYTFAVTGGTAPVKLSLQSGALPAGLNFNPATGTVSGTPTAAGDSTFVLQAVDVSDIPYTVTAPKSISVQLVGAGGGGSLAVVSGLPPNGTVGSPYSAMLQATGGTAPYTWAVTAGTLPSGLTLNSATGVISGTPTIVGTSSFTATASDSAGSTAAATFSITVASGAATGPTVTVGMLPNGTVGAPYTGSVGVSGGTPPYRCTISSGTLPVGLALGANCVITGTPVVSGTSTVSVTVTDSGNPTQNGTSQVTITINPAAVTISTGTLPTGQVNIPYSSSIGITGGTAPYTCVLTGGALPAGLTLSTNCTVSGTPTTAGTQVVMVHATDSSNPTQSVNGQVSVTINPVSLSFSTSPLPNGTVGTPYTGTVGVAGGNAPYTCTLAGGTLPAGLTLNANCTLNGTPTVAGTSSVSVHVSDSSNPAQSITGLEAITINPVPALTISAPPPATVNQPYTGTVSISGGTAPYSCTLTGGMLPAGLTLGANCTIVGTPTTVGSTTATITTKDSSAPSRTTTATIVLTVNSATVLLTIGSPATGTVGSPYTGAIPVTGGTAPYTCTLASGTLPAGLALGASCSFTGTPTIAGSSTVQVTVSDSANPAHTNTGPTTITVNPAAATLTVGNPATATVGAAYTGAIPVTGGTAPYTCTLSGGTLPTGLTLAANCTVTGTPTTTGVSTVQVTATDSAHPANSMMAPVTVTVQPVPTLTLTGSLPNAVVNQPYSQPLQAQGGVGPYTYALTAGTLPVGVNLGSNGVIAGTPTVPGAYSFTVTATDSEGTPQTAGLPLMLLVTYAPAANDALLNGPYAFLFQGYDDVAAGVLAYQTATGGSITADGSGVITAGEQDSNHQGSNPSGNTVETRNVLGTYTIGTDRRGTLTLTALNADGTVTTTNYAIGLQAAVAPATNSAQASLIEADGDQLVGTKGSGTLLAQTPGAFTMGLNGSYAFGLGGDTPCLPTCTIGIVAGPVATVGQFTAANGVLTSGTSDTNIANVNTPNSALSGTFTTADANGRVQLQLQSARLAGVPFPTDFAAYVVDANRVILVSTDKHSAFILQAGTATQQAQANFSSVSLNAPFVGYENSPVNSGLLNTTLQNTLNLSTATIFRGMGNGNSTCTTTNVDSSGAAGIISSLNGVVSAPLINALLGSYQSLGSSSCAVAENGRVVFNYPASDALLQVTLTGLGLPASPAPRVVYLTAPNQGYFLETGYAGLGRLEMQAGAPYSNAGLDGTYAFGSIPASTLATIVSSGVFTADGAGNATSTVDRNVGVGTINVLQLGVTTLATYNATDTTAGRFFLSTGEVIYEIVPGRFALLEPELLNTSAYVALLF